MLFSILLLLLGLSILIVGANWLVGGGSALAKKYNVSDLAIGLTIVAFGTSAPEMVINVVSSMNGHSDIVFGNIIGSNNFNLLAILGIAGIITPLMVQSATVWKEIPLSLFAALILFFLVNVAFLDNGRFLSRLDGVILLGFFGAFLFYVYKQLSSDPTEVDSSAKQLSSLKTFLYIVFGLGFLILGGRLAVDNAIRIAQEIGISEKVIGLTIVAAGTSLPELATSIVAAIKKNNDIAVGNIIGSNIFNIFFILGLSSIIQPIQYNPSFNIDLGVLAISTVLLFTFMFTGIKGKLDRWEAVILLLLYLAYTIFLIQKEI